MIDYTYTSTYTAGCDYDALRVFRERPVDMQVARGFEMSTLQKGILSLAVFLATFSFLVITLQNIPAFDIRSVEVLGDSSSVPPTLSAETLVGDVFHSSLFSFTPERLEKELNGNPLVQFAQVDRTSSGVKVHLSLYTPTLLFEGVSPEGRPLYLARIGGVFHPVDQRDHHFYSSKVPSLTLTGALSMQEAVELAEQVAQVVLDPAAGKDSLLANMHLHIPRLRVTIDVKEETSTDRLHTALQLIRLGSERAQADESAWMITSHQRYELSQQSLVQKQRTVWR